MRYVSVESFSKLLIRHTHFNFRLNILQALSSKLVAKEIVIRRLATSTIQSILRRDDNLLLDFKLEILKELGRAIKAKPHQFFDVNLLDCIVMNEIMVDEGKAKAVSASNKKATQIHDQM